MSKNIPRSCNLTAEYMRSILDYNPETGVFIWKYRSHKNQAWNGRFAGKMAGSCDVDYTKISIDGIHYKAHHIAWLLATGNWPALLIDHKDADPKNNKISNLRLASDSQNASNAKIYKNNTSGTKGITWRKNRARWIARITINRKVIFIGMFKDKEHAISALNEARIKYHGEFARAA